MLQVGGEGVGGGRLVLQQVEREPTSYAQVVSRGGPDAIPYRVSVRIISVGIGSEV